MESTVKKNKNVRRLIVLLSIAIPLVVAVLLGIKDLKFKTTALHFLPSVYAVINGLTAVLLVTALIMVKQKKFKLHESIIKVCMGLSVLFLACYVAYHITAESTIYGDTDHNMLLSTTEAAAVSGTRLLYVSLLISHILLSVVVIPFVLYAYLHAWEGNFTKHKKLVKMAWPIWFYVAVSGVIVYLMISPYYHH